MKIGMEDIFPHAHPIGHDGFGNYWVVDLIPNRPEWSPVFFACHDPPVIAYQTESVEEFVRQAVALWQDGPRSDVDLVHEEVADNVWRSNPGVLSRADALESSDPLLAQFAKQFESESVFVDLRSPKVGDGFSWGRYGPQPVWRRCGSERLWATTAPKSRGSWMSKILRRGGAR